MGNYRHWLVAVLITLVSALIAVGGEPAREFLKYDRLAIATGEFWRLATGHFTHLGVLHLGLNLAGLFLIWVLVGKRLSIALWLTMIVLALFVMSIGFWFLDNFLFWYVGLSGLLHGLLVVGALAGLAAQRGESVIILGLLVGKLSYEQWVGPLPGSEFTAGGPVVVNAHLYGAVAGLIGGLLLCLRARRSRSI